MKLFRNAATSSTNEESAPWRAREYSKEGEPPPITPTTRLQFHQSHKIGKSRDGSRITATLTRKVATMVTNIRNIIKQNLTMQELLR